MPNINFVPDDYVQNNESRRANVLCLVLLSVVMAGLGGSFITIKMRQRACTKKEDLMNSKMETLQKAIQQFEELQTKRRAMMKTALTTAELIEPVPRSILLASLTNNLPTGVSLVKLQFVQKEPKQTERPAPKNKYQAAQAQLAEDEETRISLEKRLETHIDIEGIAPSDLQVASYIESLSRSRLLENVALVESVEKMIDEETAFRQFKLKAILAKEVHLTKDDVDRIRTKAERSVYNF